MQEYFSERLNYRDAAPMDGKIQTQRFLPESVVSFTNFCIKVLVLTEILSPLPPPFFMPLFYKTTLTLTLIRAALDPQIPHKQLNKTSTLTIFPHNSHGKVEGVESGHFSRKKHCQTSLLP